MRKKGKKFAALILALTLFISAIPTAIAADSQRFIMAYLYMGPNESSVTAGEKFKTQVMAAGGTVDIVAPNWLDVKDSAGTIVDTTNQGFIDWAHTQGIRVVPMVSKNFSSSYIQTVLASPELRTKLINNLLSKVDQYGYDGLNLDFEGAGLEPSSGALTALVQELATGLHSRGKLATIAVMPKTGPNTPSWLGEYDYPALGKMVDYVIIMAYDQSWEGSPPGPVAGLDWASRSMSYAVSAIDPQKVIMGAPLYGRRWKDGKGGGGVSYTYAQQLLTENNGTLLWSDSAKTPYFSVRDAQGVNQVVYFENQLSLQYKMDYAAELKVAGAAFWRLGFEDTSWWPDLDLHLQGLLVGEQPPADTPPADTPPVNNPPGNNTPGNNPSGNSGGVSRGDEAVFRDISRHWAKNDIQALVARKIITGFPDGTFKPELEVTREQLAIMLARALNLPLPQQKSGLTDVPANYQYADYIYAAKSAGIINGYADQTFRPEQKATRAEVAKMLTIAIALPTTTSDITVFKDVPIKYWAAPHIAALKTAGITNGFADGSFQPEATTTRAQVAKFLNQALALKK
ncbi:MAG: S-layer homology domain-containing protein [Carboxydocellales bacterium]